MGNRRGDILSLTVEQLAATFPDWSAFVTDREGASTARVHVEVGYWLSERMVWGQRRRPLLEEDVEEGQTLRDLLDGLAAKNSGLGEVVCDRQGREPCLWVRIVYDGRLTRWKDESATALAGGDRIGFHPIYAGA